MQLKSLVLGAAVAFQATVAAAEDPKPRIYFPRHVKRQFTNTTITSHEAFPPPESTPFTSRSESRNFLTSFRSTVSDLLSSDDGDSSTSTEERSSGGSVTTVIIQSTIRVSPTVQTTAPELSEPVPSTSADESSDEPTQEPSERNSSSGGIPPIVVLPTESEEDESETETTTTRTPTTATTQTEDTTSSIVIAPTGVVTSSSPTTERDVSSADSSNTTEPVSDLPETTTTTRGLLDPIISPVISLVDDILPSIPVNETETTETTQRTTTTSDVSEPTTTQESTTTTTTGGLPDLTEILSSLTAIPTTLVPTISANSTTESDLPGETSTPPVVSETTVSFPPSLTSFPPSPSETLVPGNSTTSDLPEPTGEPSQEPSVLPSQSDTIGNGTTSVPEPSVLPSDLPDTSAVPSNTSDLVDEPSSTLPPAVPTTSGSDVPSAVPSAPSTTAEATVTVPTESWMPTTILIEQSTPTAAPTDAGSTPTTPVTMPSDLPRVISPEDVDDKQPDGTILLQVGFLYAENYEHVSNHPMAAAQIFQYLPLALADGAEIDVKRVKVVRLVPFDTTASLGYITTLARFYYPETMVDKLRMDVKIHNSLLYNHPMELVYNLTQQINSAIDIIPGQESEPGSPGGDGGSSDSPNGSNDILSNNESESTPIQKGTAAAIGIGAVGVAAAYGAAMFLVARRYKQKKQAHRRSSSIANSSEMRYNGAGSPAMMGGALLSRDFTGYGGVAGGRDSHGSGRSGAGNSVRTAQISAPVAAENSLGWN